MVMGSGVLGGSVCSSALQQPISQHTFEPLKLTVAFVSSLRGLLEVLQLDFLPRDVSEAAESQLISWHLELPGNIKDVGVMQIYTSQRDYVGLAPLVTVRDASVGAFRRPVEGPQEVAFLAGAVVC